MSERVEDISFIITTLFLLLRRRETCVPFRGIEGNLGMRILFVYFFDGGRTDTWREVEWRTRILR